MREQRSAYEANVQVHQGEVAEHNAHVVAIRDGLRVRDRECVQGYLEMVLDAVPLPEGFPHQAEVAYSPRAAYGVDQRSIDRLTSLTGRADEATWWAPWTQVVPDWLKTFVGLEGLAEREFVFEPIIIPGLLQTEEYAAAVTADSPRVRVDHGERFVSFRMARTRRLTDPDRPLHLHAVVTEGALRLAVGTPELRRAQLRHLVDMAQLPTVTLQVVRPEDGLHAAVTGQFVLLDFEQVRSIGYVELHDGAVYLQDPDQVRSYTLVTDSLQRVALGPEQSMALIESMLVQ